jgi:quinol monooxygenase YgiN
MILVNARCSIVPERYSDFMMKVQTIIPTVRSEAGCHRYELFADIFHPGVFHFIEEWESRKHLDEHIATPHMLEHFATTSPWLSAPTELTIYEISASQSITMKD